VRLAVLDRCTWADASRRCVSTGAAWVSADRMGVAWISAALNGYWSNGGWPSRWNLD